MKQHISLAPVLRGEGQGEGQLGCHLSCILIFDKLFSQKNEHGVNAGSFPPHPNPLPRSTGGEGTMSVTALRPICHLSFVIGPMMTWLGTPESLTSS